MNYSRFFALFKRLPQYGDVEGQRQLLVYEASGGRTTSLRELTAEEYRQLCSLLDRQVNNREKLRKARSVTLRLLQLLGVNTTDWPSIDAYCQQSKIAGKKFRSIDLDEHTALQRKLRAIYKKQMP